MSHPHRSLVAALILLISVGLAGAAFAAQEEIVLRLTPGPLRLALPSPDGSRLAVIGGKGVPGTDHVVVVLERGCEGEAVRQVELSRGARIQVAPEESPVDYLLLQWSPDGTQLMAADGIYRLEDKDGVLTGRRTRDLPRPLLDFRFGPAGQAAGVSVTEARTRKINAEEEGFVLTLEYAMYPVSRSLVIPIEPRERLGGFWFPERWDQVPALEWEEDGSLLLFYPYQKLTERYRRGTARDEVKERRPGPRAEPDDGPFRFEDPCRIEWELISDKKSDRVRIKT